MNGFATQPMSDFLFMIPWEFKNMVSRMCSKNSLMAIANGLYVSINSKI
ncbi:hypothetical protein RintRC_2092 [Richelia intracellularis]|nr:hypothetical protein RintRC_2092 [Richelia intracellularis]